MIIKRKSHGGSKMNEQVMRNCEMIVKNSLEATNSYKWDNRQSQVTFGAAYDKGIVTSEQINTVKRLIERNTGTFSILKDGKIRLAVNAEIMKSTDPEQALTDIKNIYETLKRKFSSGSATALAALMIHSLNKDADEMLDKMYAIYKKMDSRHYFLNSSENLAIVALMASSHKDIDEIVNESENIYKTINPYFSKSEAFVIANILSAYDDPFDWKCKAAVQISKDLKAARIKLNYYGAASMIAPLAIISLSNDNKVIVNEIREADNYLSTQKPIGGFFGVGTTIRNLLAASAVARAYTDNSEDSLIEKITVLACIRASQADDANTAYIATM